MSGDDARYDVPRLWTDGPYIQETDSRLRANKSSTRSDTRLHRDYRLLKPGAQHCPLFRISIEAESW
jgi:hypothetical protein